MKLSVIIPVYRVEATLRRCVESVLCQQVEQMEVILVDDGSPDQCPRLCDEWAQSDPRVAVVHRPNGGLSAARNSGIEMARGEWITFVDSDDWLAPDTYAPLMAELAQHADCDLLEYPVQVYEGGRDEHRLALQPCTYTDAADYWLLQRGYEHAYAWNKVYRRSLFAEVRYPVGRVFEDVPTTWQLCQKARCIRTSTSGLYHYTANPQGITCTAGHPALNSLLKTHVDVFSQLRSERTMEDVRMQHYYLHMVNIQADVYRLGPHILQLPSEPLPWNCLSDSNIPLTWRWKAAFIKLFGLRHLCQLLQTFHNIRQGRS